MPQMLALPYRMTEATALTLAKYYNGDIDKALEVFRQGLEKTNNVPVILKADPYSKGFVFEHDWHRANPVASPPPKLPIALDLDALQRAMEMYKDAMSITRDNELRQYVWELEQRVADLEKTIKLMSISHEQMEMLIQLSKVFTNANDTKTA